MTLFLKETGTPGAPTVVFLHGLITSGWMWEQQARLLSTYHCLIPDLPAHGRSRQIPWISIEDTARQIANLIQERTTQDRVHLIGLSLGSLIALQVMDLVPQSIDRVIISGTNLLPLPFRMRARSWIMLPLLKTEWFTRLASRGLRLTPEATDLYRQSMRTISRRTFRKIPQQAASFQFPNSLSSLATPVLVVAGELEHRLIHQSMQVLLSTLPGAQGYLAPAGRHGWVGEAPDLFARMARAWFDQMPLPANLIPVCARSEKHGEV